MAERILLEPQALRVFVRIEKIDRGPYSLGVEIVREQGGNPEAAVETVEDPHPRMVYLSNAAIAAEDLTATIDDLAADGERVCSGCGHGGRAPDGRGTYLNLRMARVG